MSGRGRYRGDPETGRDISKAAVEVVRVRERVSAVPQESRGTGQSRLIGESRGTGSHEAPRRQGLTSAQEHQTGMRRIDPRSEDWVEIHPGEQAQISESRPTPVERTAPPAPAAAPVAHAASTRGSPAQPGPAHAALPQGSPAQDAPVQASAAPTAKAQAQADGPAMDPTLAAKLEGLDALHARLSTATHYSLLGVSTQADTRAVRTAYFALAKRYHPDVFFRRSIGDQRKKLETVFDALTIAYETLRKPQSRSEYDDSIGLLVHERHVARPRKSSRPPALLESESDRVARESREHPLGPQDHFAEPARHATLPKLPPRPGEVAQAEGERSSARAPRPANQKSLRAQAEARAARQQQQASAPRVQAAAEARSGATFEVLPSGPAENRPSMPSDARISVPAEARPSVPNPPSAQGSDWERSTQLRELEQLKQLRHPATMPPPSGVIRRDSLPSPGARSSSPPSVPPPANLPSLVQIGLEFHGGTGLHNWISQRVREAHQEELAGHAVDAANILRLVLAQHKDARLEAHVDRLARMGTHKTVPAHRARARAAETEGRWADAAASWEAVVKATPEDAAATFALARTLMVSGDLKAAGRAAMRAAELRPTHIETRELLVEFFDRMGMKLNARREREVVAKLLESRAAAARDEAAKRRK